MFTTIVILIILFLIVSGLVAMLVITYPISKNVYKEQLVKTSPDKWMRVCSAPDNEEQLEMWNIGLEWGEKNKDSVEEVHIENDSLNLYGEYYDFGSNKCVIVLPGRCECLQYSYYFAKPYQESNMNVLVIDSRCHGKSDGKYSTIGVGEARDLKAWMRFMEKEKGIKSFWLHGICIGSAAALLAVTSDDCTKNIGGIVLEGCFINFRESFKQHMVEKKKPIFPVLDLVMMHIRRHTKTDVMKSSPIKVIDKIHYPILFLFGKKDIFSLPEKSKILFEKCSSDKKKIVWFDKGGHSHLRINNTEKYDNAIKEFIDEYGNIK